MYVYIHMYICVYAYRCVHTDICADVYLTYIPDFFRMWLLFNNFLSHRPPITNFRNYIQWATIAVIPL